ncbi:MAG: VCBS repeat-containing protein [Anaerolineae bacterium]|nr:VCBS repeat-containing protein [Anaerolineae bacterium]
MLLPPFSKFVPKLISSSTLVLALTLLSVALTMAAAGNLDTTFDGDPSMPGYPGNGRVTTDFGSSRANQGNDVALQADGKIVVAGYANNGSNDDFGLARYNANGTRDTSFGPPFNGTIQRNFYGGSTHDRAHAVAIRSTTGDIYAAGYAVNTSDGTNDMAVLRFSSSGALLSQNAHDFWGGQAQANTVGLQSTGKVIIAGYTNWAGSEDFALVRYNSDLSWDNSFGPSGNATTITNLFATDRINAIAIQSDDKIVAAGFTNNGSRDLFALFRYTNNGTPDTTFGSSGRVTTDFTAYGGANARINAVIIQPNGSIVVAGYATDGFNEKPVLARYSSSGSLDSSFSGGDGSNGIALPSNWGSPASVASQFTDLVRQTDNAIVAGGFAHSGSSNSLDFFVTRYTSSGALDTGFGSSGSTLTDFFASMGLGSQGEDRLLGLALQSDGYIVAAGFARHNPADANYDFALARYEGGAALDTTPPNTFIVNAPTNPNNDPTPTFQFFGDDSGGSGIASFQCQVDGGGFSTCASPFTAASLADGSHTFQVRAIDNATNADPSPASYTWTVDTLPPSAPLLLNPADGNDFTTTQTVTLTWQTVITDPPDGYRVDFNGSLSNVGPGTDYNSGLLANGVYTWSVTAFDAAGNENSTAPRSFTVNAAVPVLQTFSPLRNARSVPANSVISATFDQSMAAGSISNQTFAVHGMLRGLLSPAHAANGTTLTLTPAVPFKPGELVQVSASSGLLTASGIHLLPPTIWQFRAAAQGGSGQYVISHTFGINHAADTVLGDVDGDGDVDMIVGDYGGQSKLYLNDGDATFDTASYDVGPASGDAWGLALGDADGDGDLDLALGNASNQDVIYLNDGVGNPFDTISNNFGSGSYGLAFGDVDGDGDLDLASSDRFGQSKVCLNDGDGTFDTQTNNVGNVGSGQTLTLGDVDGDGDLDIIAGRSSDNAIYFNNGDGTFNPTPYTFGSGSFSSTKYEMAAGDFNNDNALDVAISHQGAGRANVIYLNDGSGHPFDTLTHTVGTGSDCTTALATGDVDGDGDLDLALGNWGSSCVGGGQDRVYLNDGDGTFDTTSANFGPGDFNNMTHGLEMADLDGDGDLDIASAIWGNSPQIVYLNDDAGPNLTLEVDRTDDTNAASAQICADATPNDCSLRGAISKANAGSSDIYTITVPAGTYTLSLNGVNEDGNAGGDLDILNDVTINGAGALTTIINADGIDTVFDVQGNAQAIFANVTVKGGNGANPPIGGGIAGRLGTVVTVTNSAVVGNSAGTAGGGISAEGTVTVNSSTISGNTVSDVLGTGGGIYVTGNLNLNNSTISGNSADLGGGINNTFGGNSVIRNSTFSGNTGNFAGGSLLVEGGTLNIQNSLVTNSTGDDCSLSGGTLTGANNLVDDTTCGGSAGRLGAVTHFDPSLTNNGGEVQTHALLAGSNAIDTGTGSCPDHTGTSLTTDQRGLTRPQGASCDIGAFEYVGANQAPIANAGNDQSVNTGAVVTLNGSSSSDPDDDTPLTFSWTQTGGPTVTLSDATAQSPTFTAPVDPATLTFSLAVTDALGLAASTPDTIIVTVNNQAPVADAGNDQSVNTSSLVTLDGSISSDPDGDTPLTYAWSQIGGPAVSLSNAATASPGFFAPSDPAVLTFSLTVTDSLGAAGATPDTIIVTVNNQAPVANAGPDQNVNPNASVTLDGSGSFDPDNDLPLTYGWSQTGGPAIGLSNLNAISPTFTAPAAPAVLTFTLMVTDNLGLADATPEEVVVAVGDSAITGLNAANSSPTVLGSATAFTATISGGSNVSYTWNFGDGQTGSGTTASHTYAAAGNYTAIVTATNSSGSVSASTSVTVTAPNAPPSFTSSPVKTATVGQAYTYNITTGDPNTGDTLSVSAPTKPAWLTLTPGSNGSATLSGIPASGDIGSNSVSLLVTDSGGLTATQSFTIAVNPASQVTCSGSSLKTLLNGAGPTINLDGNCRYLLTDQTGSAGHILYLANKSNLTINGNGATIERDSSAGNLGLIYLTSSNNVTIRNLTLKGGKITSTGNTTAVVGGGLIVYNSQNITLSGIRFIDNTAYRGGGVYSYLSTLTIYNAVFANNQATTTGAGLYTYGTSSIQIENSTFTDNFGSNPREAIFAMQPLTIRNSIIANHNVGIYAYGSTVTEDYNIFSNNDQNQVTQGATLTSGGHSFTVADLDQHFVDMTSFNYQLKPSSPAVDKGTALNTTTDANGNSRPFSGTLVDVGAYELQAVGGPSLAINKTGPTWALVNTPFVYKVIVSNKGLSAAATLRITDTLPAGASFVGNASDGGVFTNGAVVWNIGDLAVGETKTVQYEAQISQSVTNTDYRVVSISDGSIGAVGKAVETKSNSILLRNSGFLPKPDGFGFPNWGKPVNDTDLNAKNIYAVFGPSVCTPGTGGSANTCVLNAAGEGFRKTWIKNGEGGHCYGMAVGSLKFFLAEPFIDGRSSPAQFQGGAASTFDLTRNADMQNLISHYFFNQSGNPPLNPQGKVRTVTDGAPNSLVNFLITQGFDGPANDDSYTIGFWKRDRSGGHAVTPYGLEDKGGGVYWLYVYDNNYPNNFGRVVKINTNTNTWVYEGAAINPNAPASTYEGDDSTRSIVLDSVDYATNYPKKCGFCETVSTSGLSALNTGDVTEFALAGEGRLLVTNSAGQRVGYDPATGQFVNQIPGAEMSTPFNGLELNIPPVIRVPVSGTYSLKVMNTNNTFGNTEAEADLQITSPGLVVILEGLKIDSAEPDQSTPVGPFETMSAGFDYANKAISFQSSANDRETPVLSMGINTTGGKSYLFDLSGLQLAQGKTVEMSFDPATEKLSFSDDDTSQAQTYNLSATQILTDGNKNTFQQNNLTGGSGPGATVDFGTWDGVSQPTIEMITATGNNIYLPILKKSN